MDDCVLSGMGAPSEVNTEIFCFQDVKFKERVLATGQEIFRDLTMPILIVAEEAHNDGVIGVFDDESVVVVTATVIGV